MALNLVNLGQLGSTYVCSLHLCNLFDMGDPFHGQLTATTTRYPLTNIARPYRQLKCRTHRGHVVSFKFTADQVIDFYWIAGSSIFTKH